MTSFDFKGKETCFTGQNPFDRSYHVAQATFDVRVAQLLCETLNTSMRLLTSPRVTDLAQYERNPNAWVVEQLTRGLAQMTSHSVVLTPDSSNALQYSVAIGTFRAQIYFRAESVRMANNIYFLPFSADTWLALASLLLIITVVLTFVLARETRLPHQTPFDLIARIADEQHAMGVEWNKINIESTESEMLKKREHWEISEIVLVSSGALCQQGCERDPNTAAGRTLLLALFVMAVLIYTAYSASLISLISLLPDTKLEVHGWHPGNGTRILLQDTNFFRYHPEVGKAKVGFAPLTVGLLRVVNESGVAFVSERDVSMTSLHGLGVGAAERCNLARAFTGLEYQRVFAIRPGSPFKAAINYNILKLRQHGLLNREKRQLFKLGPLCTSKERAAVSGFISVDSSDTLPAMVFLSYGWAVAVIVLIIEYIIYFSSMELKTALGKSWEAAEHHAGRVLNRWMKAKLINDFKQNGTLVATSSESTNTVNST